jgi:hypothetical protein
MRACALLFLAAFPVALLSQEQTETREMVGHIGSRSALLVLHSIRATDGGWQLAGEYVLLPTLVRRFLDGEASPEIGVTTLREGTTPILFGRSPNAELRGTWRAGVFKGMRYGPGGQEREHFEFSEEFPSMAGYSAAVRCEAGDDRYVSSLSYTVESGALKSLEWRSKVAPGGHSCTLAGAEQRPFAGGLRFVSGRCSVTLRDLGEYVRASAENCAELCGSQAYLEPLLIDRRGNCRLLRPETR